MSACRWLTKNRREVTLRWPKLAGGRGALGGQGFKWFNSDDEKGRVVSPPSVLEPVFLVTNRSIGPKSKKNTSVFLGTDGFCQVLEFQDGVEFNPLGVMARGKNPRFSPLQMDFHCYFFPDGIAKGNSESAKRIDPMQRFTGVLFAEPLCEALGASPEELGAEGESPVGIFPECQILRVLSPKSICETPLVFSKNIFAATRLVQF